MALLSAQDEKVLTDHLSTLEKPVSVLLFTQTIGGSESGPVARQVLDEVARLNDKIRVEEKNFILDLDDRGKYGIDQSPALVFLADGEDTRMRMFGAPTGYEFVSLVEAILSPAPGASSSTTRPALIAGADKPTKMQVFSTPT